MLLLDYQYNKLACRFWDVTQLDSEKSEQVSCFGAGRGGGNRDALMKVSGFELGFRGKKKAPDVSIGA